MKLLLYLFLSTIYLYATINIMPLGDSITYDDYHSDDPDLGGTPRPESERHAYRNFLWYKLKDTNYDINFVGSRNAGSAIVPAFDPDNEGYPGETSSFIADHIYTFLQNNPADIILLHIGTNDWSSDVSHLNDILDEINRYEMTYYHPVKVIVALIIQKTEYSSIIHDFNINLKKLITTRQNSTNSLYLVDMEHDANLYYDSRDFQEKTHPNDSGYEKMATLWYKQIKIILDNQSSYGLLPAIYHVLF